MDSQRPSRVCTLLATATWVCRSGSPARLSRWLKEVATRPRTLTCRMPCGPVRVNRACFSMNAKASLTAAWWACSIAAATAGSATAHKVDTDFTGENVKSYPATVYVRWPGIFRDLSRQLPGIDRPPAMLGQEKLTGHLRPHPGPICSRQRRAHRQTGRAVDRPDAPGHLEPKGADDTINDLERSSKTGRLLEVAWGEVRSFQLLLAELGQRVQTAAEQRSHLLGGHRVADGQAVDPDHAGADPHPGRLSAFGVVGRQPGMTFLGRVQGCDLPGHIVI